MFDRVAGASPAIRELLDSFEPGCALVSDAKRLVVELAELDRLVVAAKTLCAARVAETRLWARSGDRTPAHWLAKTTATTIGDADCSTPPGSSRNCPGSPTRSVPGNSPPRR